MMDTLSVYKRLTAVGVSPGQAEAFIGIFCLPPSYTAEEARLYLITAGFSKEEVDIFIDVGSQIKNLFVS